MQRLTQRHEPEDLGVITQSYSFLVFNKSLMEQIVYQKRLCCVKRPVQKEFYKLILRNSLVKVFISEVGSKVPSKLVGA